MIPITFNRISPFIRLCVGNSLECLYFIKYIQLRNLSRTSQKGVKLDLVYFLSLVEVEYMCLDVPSQLVGAKGHFCILCMKLCDVANSPQIRQNTEATLGTV